jgi:hypothetical protein
MWIVALALRRPYTFTVFAILILIAGVVAIVRTPKDIFPSISIPVISSLWNYTGMSAEGMESHITSQFERSLTTTVDNIEHIESQSIYGNAIIKVFLQPTASVATGIAQVTSIAQAALRQMPVGMTPPLVLSYTASNVPVLRIGLSGKGLDEQRLNDLALQFVRTQLITVPGAAVPYPYGGKQRYVSVDLNYQKLQALGMTPTDVVNAIANQNVILPSGTMKIAQFEYQVGMNASPLAIEELNAIPIKTNLNGSTIYVRDVANVRNGFIPPRWRFGGSRRVRSQGRVAESQNRQGSWDQPRDYPGIISQRPRDSQSLCEPDLRPDRPDTVDLGLAMASKSPTNKSYKSYKSYRTYWHPRFSERPINSLISAGILERRSNLRPSYSKQRADACNACLERRSFSLSSGVQPDAMNSK